MWFLQHHESKLLAAQNVLQRGVVQKGIGIASRQLKDDGIPQSKWHGPWIGSYREVRVHWQQAIVRVDVIPARRKVRLRRDRIHVHNSRVVSKDICHCHNQHQE